MNYKNFNITYRSIHIRVWKWTPPPQLRVHSVNSDHGPHGPDSASENEPYPSEMLADVELK